jgi:hypothetical protein
VATFESEGTYSAGSSARGTIPEGIAADVPNGLYVDKLGILVRVSLTKTTIVSSA